MIRMVTQDGYKIGVGDVLRNEHDYFVVACKDKSGHWYGSLLCAITDSCRNIPYALNNGSGYFYTGIRINQDQAKDYQ